MATDPQGNLQEVGPSDRLMAMFRTCSKDPTEAVKGRLKRMLQMFVQHFWEDKTTKATVAQCCIKAKDWYYWILEDLVSQERKRSGFGHVSGILEEELMQRSLVACCLEISICSSSLQCDFPLLLQILETAPYHFWRVIERVLLSETRLPDAAFKHLRLVEEKVVESLAWTNSSPLWEEIRANEGHLPSCHQVMPPAWLDQPRNDFQPESNLPADASSEADLSASVDQHGSTSAVNRPQGRNSLHLFVRKVYGLMGRRLRSLCSLLEISDELRLKIWTCFEHSLINHTHLMIDRHLDQLLMCAIYMIAKITRMEIPFKLIMENYKSQPNTSRSVCKTVLISERSLENPPTVNDNSRNLTNGLPTPNTPSEHYPEPHQEQKGNLILFYNQVYTKDMESFAMLFSPTFEGTPPLSPYPRQRKAPPRRHRVLSNLSVFVSTYEPESPPPGSPGLSYVFNSTPRERLRQINNMIQTHAQRGYVVPLDDGPSAKRFCSDQSVLQRLLRNVMHDRAARGTRDGPSLLH
ncbi:retinoblastoma-like protein 2 isoform X2 [Echeneis naucrates]|uniref:Retinoblastoma-associated protein A-box domain-containing protein n=1 Tax=Echeneis naucrates TaxID=173247 RepID=A0A665VE00_ECHNA|nr:retinoblastoma-like protein 2 isoform X2 [Echeneis naucrates]